MGRIDAYPAAPVPFVPSQTLAYAEVTANQSGITAEVDLTGLAATVTVPAGRRLKITGVCLNQSSVADDIARLRIKEGGSALQLAGVPCRTAGQDYENRVEVVITPSAGIHTYKLAMDRQAGTGNIQMSAGGIAPAYILVEDITGQTAAVPVTSVPVGVLAYAEVQTTQGTFTAETDLTGLSVNVNVPAGRQLRITGFTHPQSSVAGDNTVMRIKEGSTALEESVEVMHQASRTFDSSATVVVSPSAGAHTYKLTMARLDGTGNISNAASSSQKGYILVEDITPTPSPASGAPSSTLAYAEVSTSQGSITTETDLTGLTTTITVPAGRRIKITGRVYVEDTVATDTVALYLKEGATYLNLAQQTGGWNFATDLRVEAVISPSAGTHTYKLALQRSVGTGTVTMDVAAPGAYPRAFLLVEDITGSSIGAHTHTELDDTGWVTLPLLAGWVSYDNTYGLPAYRKIGKQVFLRGLIKSGTAANGTNIAQLPAGFRPGLPKIRVITTSNELFAQLDIASDGNIYIATGGSATFLSLNVIPFIADN